MMIYPNHIHLFTADTQWVNFNKRSLGSISLIIRLLICIKLYIISITVLYVGVVEFMALKSTQNNTNMCFVIAGQYSL